MLCHHRATQGSYPRTHPEEDRLVTDTIELARQFGGQWYRRFAALLRDAGWSVGGDRVEWLSAPARLELENESVGKHDYADLMQDATKDYLRRNWCLSELGPQRAFSVNLIGGC